MPGLLHPLPHQGLSTLADIKITLPLFQKYWWLCLPQIRNVGLSGGWMDPGICYYKSVPILFYFWPHCVACGILFPWPGIEPTPPALEAWSPNHWTAREVPTTSPQPLLKSNAQPGLRSTELKPINHLIGRNPGSWTAPQKYSITISGVW